VEKQDERIKTAKTKSLLERFQRLSFPPAAVAGAFVSFAATAFRSAPENKVGTTPENPLAQVSFSEQRQQPNSRHFEIEYAPALFAGTQTHPFQHSLLALAVDSEDRMYVLGDGEVRIFKPNGDWIRSWKAPEGAQCLSVSSGDRICFGLAGGIVVTNAAGSRTGGFEIGETNRPASITSVKIHGNEILAADATARCIRRFDWSGKALGLIGAHGKIRGFMLPNKYLDISVDAGGRIHATDSGRHQVTSWKLDGESIGSFGKFGLTHPEDFVGCCNPVNLAIAPDGKIVTAEKVIARVKIFDASGKLLALIGPEHFDAKCIHLYLAVDSKGRIFVGDPMRLNLQIFTPLSKREVGKSI
jgi:hypothetical protein